jgi:hypothetical protein
MPSVLIVGSSQSDQLAQWCPANMWNKRLTQLIAVHCTEDEFVLFASLAWCQRNARNVIIIKDKHGCKIIVKSEKLYLKE